MNKVELVGIIADKTGVSKKDTKQVVDSLLEEITISLSKKESVTFVGFGTFSTAHRNARTAKIPATDRTVDVPETTVAKFKVGKKLKDAVAE